MQIVLFTEDIDLQIDNFCTNSVVHREYRFIDSSFLYRQCCSQRIQIYRFIISIQIAFFTEDIDLQIHHFYIDSVVHGGYRLIDLSFLYRQCCSQRIQIYRFIISIQIQCCSQRIQIYRFIISIQIVLFTENIDLQIYHFNTDSVVHREYRFIETNVISHSPSIQSLISREIVSKDIIQSRINLFQTKSLL